MTPSLTANFSNKRVALGDPAGTVISGVSAPATAGDDVVLQKLNGDGWVHGDTTSSPTPRPRRGGEGAAFGFDPLTPRSVLQRLPGDRSGPAGRNTVTCTQGTVKAYDAEIAAVEPGSVATKRTSA